MKQKGFKTLVFAGRGAREVVVVFVVVPSLGSRVGVWPGCQPGRGSSTAPGGDSPRGRNLGLPGSATKVKTLATTRTKTNKTNNKNNSSSNDSAGAGRCGACPRLKA